MRVFRVSRICSVKPLDARFERPENFDLRDFWEEWSGTFINSLHGYHTMISVASEGEGVIGDFWQGTVESLRNAAAEDGWKRIDVTFANENEALWQILQFGALVRVESPPSLRDAVRDAALRIAGMYGE